MLLYCTTAEVAGTGALVTHAHSVVQARAGAAAGPVRSDAVKVRWSAAQE